MLRFLKKIEPRNSNFHPGFFWLFFVVLLLASATAIEFLGASPNMTSQLSTPTPEISREPKFYTVTYKSGVFSPTNLRIHAGDTVRFKNDGFFGIRIITDNNQLPGFDSVGDIPQGSYFSYTFGEKGIFGYHNGKSAEEPGTIIVR